jgi:ABC-type branched-subunit amino acid transport system substrate-binding protein
MTGKISSYFRMGKGADAWFKHVNDTGGINGRMVKYKMVDDKYEPARTKSIVKRFAERDKCFAIVAPLGSAPTAAVIDYIVSKDMPLIGAGTGAEKNLTYPSKWVFPLYPAYFTEGQQLVRFAKEVFGAKTVALLYQNDPSGKTHIKGIESVLDKYGMKLLAKEGYDQKEIDVSSQVIAMKSTNPDAVLCSCAPEPAARFYTERKKLGWNVPVVNVFFGKSPKVAELAGKDAVDGVYFATIFRDFNSPAPQIQQAKMLLKKYYPNEQPDAIHLWGFAGAQVFTEAMKRMGRDNITRDRLVTTLEGIQDWKGSVVPSISIGRQERPVPGVFTTLGWLIV